MNQLEKIQKLTPEFQGTILSTLNYIEVALTEIIAVDITDKPEKIEERVQFFQFFEEMTLERKIGLVNLILKINYPSIYTGHPDYYAELNDLRKIRNTIAHNYVAFEANSDKTKAYLLLESPIVKKKIKLSERKMRGLMKKAEKVKSDTISIHKYVGQMNQLIF